MPNSFVSNNYTYHVDGSVEQRNGQHRHEPKPSLPNTRDTHDTHPVDGEIYIGGEVGRAGLKVHQVARAVDGERGQRDLRLGGGWCREYGEPRGGGVVGAGSEGGPRVAPVLVLGVARGQ